MRRYFMAIPVILTVAAGCDNVAWGGIEVSLEPPPHDSVPVADTALVEAAPAPAPQGPLLLAGSRTGSTVTLSPVGMLLPDGLAPVPATVVPTAASGGRQGVAALLEQGTEWVLFAEGVRVGSMTVTETGTSTELCGAAPTVSGPPELLPGATSAERFLALPAGRADDWPYETYRALEHTYDQRVGSLRLAGEAVPEVGATWPTEGLLPARRDVQAFHPVGSPSPSVAATFAYRDRLDTSAPAEGAFALFVLAEPVGGRFVDRFTWYRPATEQGKAVPRFFSHLDWDEDGEGEAILEVFGQDSRWYVALERAPDGSWTEVLRTDCGGGAPASAGR